MSDNVIQIGELLIRRRQEKHTYLKDERCHHRKMTWDDNGQIVTCDACGIQLSPYWALHQLAHFYDKEMSKLKARAEQLEQDKSHNLHLIAAKKVEAVWRSRNMAPCCPHCGRGILPEDKLGDAQTRRDFELRRRQARPDEGKRGMFRG